MCHSDRRSGGKFTISGTCGIPAPWHRSIVKCNKRYDSRVLFDNCNDIGVEMNGAQVDDKNFLRGGEHISYLSFLLHWQDF